MGIPVKLTVLKSAHLLHLPYRQETLFSAACEVWEEPALGKACTRVSQLFLVFKVGGPGCPSPPLEVRERSQQG